MFKCDVIIPIYNAYDCVKECIESVIQNTDFNENELILINDKSTDKRILPLLKKFEKKYPFIVVLNNKENLGFVGSVNRGMQYSKNDVVLLNSDTEVTKNWLKKLSNCAYSSDCIATATPLSNNATLASVPMAFVPNNLPDGYSLEEMGALVEECSRHEYPEVPTGHGFCLYIKRSVLDEVGLFDEEAYGKGYGEENDFCFRCLDHGYKHVLCDDTYIYHKESQSFSDSKIRLQEEASKVLRGRYPIYCEKLDIWVARKPHKYVIENVASEIGIRKGKKNILCIIHDWNPANLGGTTLHLDDLVKILRKKYNFHILAPGEKGYVLRSYWETTESVIKFPEIQELHSLRYYNDDWKEMLETIVESFAIDILHIHHLLNHYLDIIEVIKKYKLYTIISLHDYYSVCPLVTKMFNNKTYCGDYCEEQCNKCLKCTLNLDYGTIKNWHKNWLNLFAVCNKIICPSENSKQEVLKTYPDLKIDVIEHGIELEHHQSDLIINDTKKINVAFIGAIGIHKGSKILENLIIKDKNPKIKFHLFGLLDSKYNKSNKHYINHGPYSRTNLPNLMKENDIKIVCLLSVCPETFSYTLSESVASGVPIIGFDIGAIGERIKKNNLGWVIDANSTSQDLITKIIEIQNNPNEYQEKIKSINSYKLKTTEMMADDYANLYDKAIIKESSKLNRDAIFELMKKSDKYISIFNYANYAWVFDTLKWKIVSKIKTPKIVKKIYHGVRKK